MTLDEARKRMLSALLQARTRAEIEATQKEFDLYLSRYPSENDVDSPVWIALGQMTRISLGLQADLDEGIDSDALALEYEEKIKAILV